ETQRIVWDTKKGGIMATTDKRLGHVTLQSVPFRPTDDDTIPVICEAVRAEGRQLLHFAATNLARWQNRVLSLKHWRPEYNWPAADTDTLLKHPEKWLAPYLVGIRKVDELKKLDLLNILTHSLSYDQQLALNRLAPPALPVPSGSNITLDYT